MPAGVFKETYAAELGILRYPIHWAGLVLGAGLALALPLIVGEYYLMLAVSFMIFLIGAVGLNITLGLAGLISLAHAALMGMGAYVTAFLAQHGVNVLLAIPIAGLTAAALAFILALPSFKLKGYYLAMASLAAQFILEYLFALIDPDQYEPVPDEAKYLGGIYIGRGIPLYYITLAVTIIALLAATNITRSTIGRGMKAVRDNDVAAEVIGVNVYYVKALAFTIGGFYAGIAGAIYALYSTGIGWEGFTLEGSIEYLGMVLIGGPGRVVWGSFLGVLVVRTGWTLLESLLATAMVSYVAAALKYLILGGLIAAFMILEPEGLIAVLRRIKEYLRLWPYSY